MVYNLQTIQSRLQRMEDYIKSPRLRSILSGGVTEMDPKEIGNKEVHCGLEEGTWCYNLLKYVCDRTNNDAYKLEAIREYIEAFTALEAKKEWGTWEVDSANNDWAPIWVRLVDKLRQALAKNPEYKLSNEDNARVTAVYEKYRTVKHGVDDRRVKHDAMDRDFETILAGDRYAKVRDAVRHPVTKEVTPKHLGMHLLETEDVAVRHEYITLYYEALTARADLAFAKKLADYFMKHIGKQYAETYVGDVPAEDANLVKRLDATFRQALVK